MGTLTKIFCEKTVRNRKRNIGFIPKNFKRNQLQSFDRFAETVRVPAD
ncbi:hypothetical protein LEP1GSC187_3807 [Leptospira santarosai str. ZUN179]|uniref:Uncharacterized protein n=1 Tax=Leptospira santarosai str. ZUN179 TaxID=1049985 RepID=M6UGK5_9LEPT|nr:hypothetical protein LEP1GSC187_3807 [Leptospira santarosai str. ZUN179]